MWREVSTFERCLGSTFSDFHCQNFQLFIAVHFSYQPSEIIEKCTEAKDMLEKWKQVTSTSFFFSFVFEFFIGISTRFQSYYDVRAEIEQSGRDSRWEFDNKRLFKLTDHMAIICNDFIAIAKELEEFYNIFTPELKSVTGKPHKINEILERVHKVLELIEHVSFSFAFFSASFSIRSVLGAVRSVSYRRFRKMETRFSELCATNRRN